jgi:hypothetical protein
MGSGQGRTKSRLGSDREKLASKEPEGFGFAPIRGQVNAAVENFASSGRAQRDIPRGNETELAQRTALAITHLVGFGLSKDAARVAIIVSDTREIPVDLLEMSMRKSRQFSTDKFPPTVGEIVSIAKKICQESQPDLYRTNAGGLRAPEWLHRMQRARYTTGPRQLRSVNGKGPQEPRRIV